MYLQVTLLYEKTEVCELRHFFQFWKISKTHLMESLYKIPNMFICGYR